MHTAHQSTAMQFQHTAARRRLRWQFRKNTHPAPGFNTQPRGGGCKNKEEIKLNDLPVSTHSRAEAAARTYQLIKICSKCFNTQPRGGGCFVHIHTGKVQKMFQHTATRRRLLRGHICIGYKLYVSTHSRAEAAASFY